MDDIDPVKACCGYKKSQHNGPQCPDKRVLCSMCLNRYKLIDLYTLSSGGKVDVCKECAKDEPYLS